LIHTHQQIIRTFLKSSSQAGNRSGQ